MGRIRLLVTLSPFDPSLFLPVGQGGFSLADRLQSFLIFLELLSFTVFIFILEINFLLILQFPYVSQEAVVTFSSLHEFPFLVQ